MSLTKLSKRLTREMKASPKKAGALGLLLLVAIYYWMPLLTGRIGGEEVAEEPAAALPDAGFGPMVLGQVDLEPAAAASEVEPAYDWEQLARWLGEDKATRPSEELATRRSPFESAEAKIVEVEQDVDEPESVEPLLTPDSLGIALSGTVVGPGRRVALIGGKAYAEGRSVESIKDDRVIEFKLTAVHAERIVLERLGQHFELAIPPRQLAGQIESIEF